jgi:thiamine-phosphate diphosphorylase
VKRLPSLHVIANDDVVARPAFMSNATSILRGCGGAVAIHVRLKRASARVVYDVTRELADIAASAQAGLFVNDRCDIAAACGATGVQLGAAGIPVRDVRNARDSRSSRSSRTSRAIADLVVGYSAHAADEALAAVVDGADFIVLGTIWPSATHAGAAGAGVGLIAETVACIAPTADRPVIAIGGVTPARAREAVRAGAGGVAVIRGVWDAAEPVGAAAEYLESMQVV